MTILYVDDDTEDIEIFQDAVRAVDPAIECRTAFTGTEALKYLQEVQRLPDYVVLDINMPGMDGKYCLHEIRKDPRLSSLTVIVYSTNCFPGDVAEIESLNATFIRKANSFNDLCETLRRIVSGQHPV